MTVYGDPLHKVGKRLVVSAVSDSKEAQTMIGFSGLMFGQLFPFRDKKRFRTPLQELIRL